MNISIDEINSLIGTKSYLVYPFNSQEYNQNLTDFAKSIKLTGHFHNRTAIVTNMEKDEKLLVWISNNLVYRVWAIIKDQKVCVPTTYTKFKPPLRPTPDAHPSGVYFVDPKYYDATKSPREYRGLRLIYESLRRATNLPCYYNAFVVNNSLADHKQEAFDKEEQLFFREILDDLQNCNISHLAVSWQRNYTERFIALVRTVRQQFPDLSIICGGPMVTETVNSFPYWHPFHPFNWITDSHGVPLIDTFFVGESEESITSYFKNKTARGTHSYQRSTGLYVITPANDYPNINKLPLLGQFETTPLTKSAAKRINAFINQAGTIEGARGCPHNCAYCPGPAIRSLTNPYPASIKPWCQRDAKTFVTELKLMTDSGITEVFVCDNTFTANKEWVRKVTLAITENRIKAKLVIYSRIDDFITDNNIDHKLIENLVKIGVTVVSLGFESADRDILSAINKKLSCSTDKYELVFSALKEAGLMVRLTAIFGFSQETYETASCSRELMISYAQKKLVDHYDVHNETELEHTKEWFTSENVRSFIETEGKDLPLKLFRKHIIKNSDLYFHENSFIRKDNHRGIFLHHHFFNDSSGLNIPLDIFPENIFYGNSMLTLKQIAELTYDVMRSVQGEMSAFSSRSGN